MRKLTGLIDSLMFVNVQLASVFKVLAWTFLMFMTFSIVLQVFCRKVLNNSLFWPEDVSLMMMIWVAFATAPIAYRMGANVSLDPVLRLFKGRFAHLMQLMIHLLIITMLIMLVIESVKLIGRTQIRANSIPLSMKYVYMIMPIGMGAMVVVGVELVMRNIVGLINPDNPHSEAPENTSTQVAEAL